jgi:hypothetical protein
MPGPLMGSGGGWLKVWLRRKGRAVSSQKRNYAYAMLGMPLPVSLSCPLSRPHTQPKHPDWLRLESVSAHSTPVISGLQHDAARRDAPKG